MLLPDSHYGSRVSFSFEILASVLHCTHSTIPCTWTSYQEFNLGSQKLNYFPSQVFDLFRIKKKTLSIVKSVSLSLQSDTQQIQFFFALKCLLNLHTLLSVLIVTALVYTIIISHVDLKEKKLFQQNALCYKYCLGQ